MKLIFTCKINEKHVILIFIYQNLKYNYVWNSM